MRVCLFKTAGYLGLALVLFSLSAPAQKEEDDQPIRVQTAFVNVPVIASDRMGRSVSGLTKENFSITQDGVPQDIQFFADDRAPMSVVILIDASVSTKPHVEEIKNAAKEFIKFIRPEDRCMVVTFGAHNRVLQDFTADQETLSRVINTAVIGEDNLSIMNDAVYLLVNRTLAGVKGRKAIIVLTDGETSWQAVTPEKLTDSLIEGDVAIYPIIYPNIVEWKKSQFPKTLTVGASRTKVSRDDHIKNLKAQFEKKMEFMASLATNTSGRLIENKDKSFAVSFQQIADELKNQYIIGYQPPEAGDGKEHKITVNVDKKDVVVRGKRIVRLRFDPSR